MEVTDKLEAIRAEVPECVAVAFADLSARMVLSVSTRTRQPQEALDDLSAAAADLLDGPAAAPMSRLLGEGTSRVGHAVTQSRSETRIYVRSSSDPAEALCCICAPMVDIDAVMLHAKAALEHIGGKG